MEEKTHVHERGPTEGGCRGIRVACRLGFEGGGLLLQGGGSY